MAGFRALKKTNCSKPWRQCPEHCPYLLQGVFNVKDAETAFSSPPELKEGGFETDEAQLLKLWNFALLLP